AHFYDNDPQKPFTQWTQYMIETTRLAQHAVKVNYHHHPHRTYAVGTSNGGYQVRRALEEAPELFDGGVDWEGTFIDPRGPNILIDLPPAIKNFPDYVASGFDPNSQAAKNIVAAGYPPDIVNNTVTPTDSLWLRYSNSFWEVTACQWQERFDPTYDTYGAGLGNYDYLSRIHTVPGVFRSVDQVETTGDIGKPLITVAGTMDALLPIKRGARAYEDAVLESREHHYHDWDDDRDHHHGHHPAYRLYEVQNGNHIEANVNFFPQLVVIQPHAQKAFDLLVDHVENHEKLPPSQCIPKGGAIAQHPTDPGHCANLFVP
ncbi:MAG: 3-hydroxybutyrate oligomer hydrolase family protein, partial [Terriglobales bacterium]